MSSHLPFLPSDPACLARARTLGAPALARRRADAAADVVGVRRQMPTPDEQAVFCEELTAALRSATTLDEQGNVWERFRREAYALFQNLGPVPPPLSDEPIPEHLAGYRPTQVVRILHRMAAEIARIHAPEPDWDSLRAEPQGDPEADPFYLATDLEIRLEDVNSSSQIKADRAETLNVTAIKQARWFKAFLEATENPATPDARDPDRGGDRPARRPRR
jgi:hypothetical protein